MKILALSDIHGELAGIAQIADPLREADVVLLSGDITNFAGSDKIHQVLDVLGRYSSQVLAVHGNCDLPIVEEVLEDSGISLHGRCVALDGIQFAGVGGSEPSAVIASNQRGESGFEKILQKILPAIQPDQPLVLVTHQPPYGTKIDAFSQDRHTGSRTIRRFIEKVHPILTVSGHIHEARGQDKVGKTVVINPGPFNRGFYATVQIDGDLVKSEFHCIE